MKGSELLRLVLLNLNQNKFKTIMTSIGIVVGAATIVMVIAIGRGSQMDVEEQFSNLNAGAIDVSYEWEGEDTSSSGRGGFMAAFGNMMGGFMNNFSGGGAGNSSGFDAGQMPSGAGSGMPSDMGGGMPSDASSGMPSDMGGGMPSDASGEMPSDAGGDMTFDRDGQSSEDASGSGQENSKQAKQNENSGQTEQETEEAESESDTVQESVLQERLNQNNVILTAEDVSDIESEITGISGVTISYTTRTQIEGGTLTDAQTYTVAGVKENYLSLSNLSMYAGSFFEAEADENKERSCVLGAGIAKELFGSIDDACDSTLYIDDREYTIIGVISATSMVSAGITADDTIFVPYQTGIKYITGESISPKITVMSENVNKVSEIEAEVDAVLQENYTNTEFTYSDAGSKMEAAESSSRILTMLLSAMAAIVFLVGGIGIMNVLFVSVKERTNEIGILKALGASKSTILFEFLIESAAISLIGGVLGVGISFIVTPVIEHYGMRVEANAAAWIAALGFAILTGTLFGLYPAAKAAKLIPIEALNAE